MAPSYLRGATQWTDASIVLAMTMIARPGTSARAEDCYRAPRGVRRLGPEEQVTRPAIDSFVRLIRDFPELGLTRGQVGAVKAVWCEPLGAFEIEFIGGNGRFPTRALLLDDAIDVVQVEFAESSRRSP